MNKRKILPAAALALGVAFLAPLAASAQNQENAPSVTSISPNSAPQGSSGMTITVDGSNFQNESTVSFNGNQLNTNYVSDTQLRADLTSEDLANAGMGGIAVSNPDGTMSNATQFEISSVGMPDTGLAPENPVNIGALASAIFAASLLMFAGIEIKGIKNKIEIC